MTTPENRMESRQVTSLRQYLTDMKETISQVKWVIDELADAKSKRGVRYIAITQLITSALRMGQPWVIHCFLAALMAKQLGGVVASLAALAILSGLTVLSNLVAKRLIERIDVAGYVKRNELINRALFSKSLGQFVSHSSLLSASNIDEAREKIHQVFTVLFLEVTPIVTVTVATWVFLFSFYPVAGLATAIAVALYGLTSLYLNFHCLKFGIPIEQEYRVLSRYRHDRWQNVQRVKTNGKENTEANLMNERCHDLADRELKFYLWYANVGTLRGAITTLTLLFVASYAGYQVWYDQIAITLLYPILSWTTQVSSELWRVAMCERRLNANMPHIRSLRQALELPVDIKVKPDAIKLDGSQSVGLTFDNVSFGYQSGRKTIDHQGVPVIRNFNLAINQGEKVALIGPSGAGKTTIMRLVLRFMDPDQGTICVNNHDLRDIDLTSWGQTIGYIPQQPQVFDGTIRYNLTYGLSAEDQAALSDERIWRVMGQLKIDFGPRLVDGLDTKIGRNGIQLSGGQQQRLMIGAAAIKTPPFMLIDEATSSLDVETEHAVQQGLDACLTSDSMALIITHRLSTVRHLCDKFVVMRELESRDDDKPQVEAVGGSFEELNETSPTFRRLAKISGLSFSDQQSVH